MYRKHGKCKTKVVKEGGSHCQDFGRKGFRVYTWYNLHTPPVFLGFGVFTTKPFLRGEFLLEYVGRRKEQKELEDSDHSNNFLFGYVFNGKSYW